MKNLSTGRLGGFTLIELLVVVLIIGILAAVALPQYQKAVDKSRYATLMPVATNVKNAQETFYMASAEYTDDLRNLDIQLPGTLNGNKAEFGDGVKVEVSADGTNDYVSASKDGLDNKYVMYFAQSANFPKEIHCEALSSSERAKQLCLGMGGTEVGANGAYTAYVLEGSGSGTLNGGSTGGNTGKETTADSERFSKLRPYPTDWTYFYETMDKDGGWDMILEYVYEKLGEEATQDLKNMNVEYMHGTSGGGLEFISQDGRYRFYIELRSYSPSLSSSSATRWAAWGQINGKGHSLYNYGSNPTPGLWYKNGKFTW